MDANRNGNLRRGGACRRHDAPGGVAGEAAEKKMSAWKAILIAGVAWLAAAAALIGAALTGEWLWNEYITQAEPEKPAICTVTDWEEPVPAREIRATQEAVFTVTAYCPCVECCGEWSGGATYSGVMPEEGRTVSVDPKIIPLGSTVYIGGHAYIAEDTGSAIRGYKIDLYFESHAEALAYGVQEVTVQWVE